MSFLTNHQPIARAAAFFVFYFVFTHVVAAAVTNLWVEEGVTISSYDGFHVDSVEDKTGELYEFDVTGTMETHIKEQFNSAGMKVFSGIPANKKSLLLRSQLTLYQAGSALERWVGLFGPGADAACVLRVMMVDGISGELVGDTVLVRNVRRGFLGSPEAEQAMLEDVAEALVAAIQSRIDDE
ncbi:MAG: hypothetical protein ACR2QW_06740 [bacterium]